MSSKVHQASQDFTPRAGTCLYAAVNFIIGIVLAAYALVDAQQHWSKGVDWEGMALYLAGMTLCVVELVRTHEHWGTALANAARRVRASTGTTSETTSG